MGTQCLLLMPPVPWQPCMALPLAEQFCDSDCLSASHRTSLAVYERSTGFPRDICFLPCSLHMAWPSRSAGSCAGTKREGQRGDWEGFLEEEAA